MHRTSLYVINALLVTNLVWLTACSQLTRQTMVTIADARQNQALFIDSGKPGDSPGDTLTFDQPLLDEQLNRIGNNSGICTRIRVGHIFQCQWTLSFEHGSIQVAGREFDHGTSTLSIVGGTGIYSGITGEMESTPNSGKNNDGTFTQTLRYWLRP